MNNSVDFSIVQIISCCLQIATCERLVHDQHLMQQGWRAVVANLEDVYDEFKKKSGAFLGKISASSYPDFDTSVTDYSHRYRLVFSF